MAEFQEVMKQAQRMCEHRKNKALPCCDCDAFHICQWSLNCVGLDTLVADADSVMAWAAEHPEPVYPEWYTWLVSMDVVPKKVPPDVASMLADIGLLRQIPAHTAQRLGIEPKVVG